MTKRSSPIGTTAADADTLLQTDCAHKDQSSKEDTKGANRTSIFPENFPVSLDSIKEYITELDGDMYIPLHSTIQLKKRRRMLYLPLEFGEITMIGLVDSRAFIIAMSWSVYNLSKMNSDNCVIEEFPQPPFKIECANAQLEQPIATADIQFNNGTYTFTDTFVIQSNGYNKRNHQLLPRRDDAGNDRRNEKLQF